MLVSAPIPKKKIGPNKKKAMFLICLDTYSRPSLFMISLAVIHHRIAHIDVMSARDHNQINIKNIVVLKKKRYLLHSSLNLVDLCESLILHTVSIIIIANIHILPKSSA